MTPTRPTSISRPPAAAPANRTRGVWTRRAPRDALLDTPAAHDTQPAEEPRDDASEPRAGMWALPPSAGRLLAA